MNLPVNMPTERITQAALAHAIRAVEVMNHEQKVGLADEIFQYQPNLLASILALPGMGVNMSEVEIALHVLLVAFEAMKRSGQTWPVVSEQVQEMCLQRLTGHMRFNEGLPVKTANELVRKFCDEHREPQLLAFAYGHLGDHKLLGVQTDAHKPLVLAVLNLVECIAYVEALPKSG